MTIDRPFQGNVVLGFSLEGDLPTLPPVLDLGIRYDELQGAEFGRLFARYAVLIAPGAWAGKPVGTCDIVGLCIIGSGVRTTLDHKMYSGGGAAVAGRGTQGGPLVRFGGIVVIPAGSQRKRQGWQDGLRAMAHSSYSGFGKRWALRRSKISRPYKSAKGRGLRLL